MVYHTLKSQSCDMRLFCADGSQISIFHGTWDLHSISTVRIVFVLSICICNRHYNNNLSFRFLIMALCRARQSTLDRPSDKTNVWGRRGNSKLGQIPALVLWRELKRTTALSSFRETVELIYIFHLFAFL